MIPLLAIAAWGGMGKTTLLKRLIPEPHVRGVRPGLIKHTHHNMDVGKLGKDSYKLRKAGTAQTLIVSQQRWALVVETPGGPELDLVYLVSRMDVATLDLVLAEGLKREPVTEIMFFRDGCGHNPEELVIDEYVITVVSNVPLAVDVPLLNINGI